MENLYQLPTKGCSTKKERDLFWHRVIANQKTSGLTMVKFCQQHQISVSAFKKRKYKLQEKEIKNFCNKADSNIKAKGANFIPVNIIDAIASNNPPITESAQIQIKICLKNGYVLEILLPAKEDLLLGIIMQVSRLSC